MGFKPIRSGVGGTNGVNLHEPLSEPASCWLEDEG